ncbi:Lrp/AsnC family transcriptional regulator, leucine-responsive regulatory protein [Oryzomicrobium terrae]|uniref:Lrp/AsnC family transcriptional regulator, leucine-responsive regulatory protein n=1 Tax=Oryzomicrobium terrae TaxID=1735038 RepID=A0A5C1E6D9_9RHOO|nr:Lrp/AsnC ligand binding domain-containing protein [Oryzomicrobium terrae]QEL64460.1 Lrp/AsnC family transcriptional regulator, leucine-responsive regulatory protein [Oryzomicrobium terrae]
MTRFDTIDLAILDALQQDGRITNVALAKKVGLSPTPCVERVKTLEAAGVIAGYAARLSAEPLGLGLLVYIEISIDRTSQRAFEDFRRAVVTIPEVQECHMVAGSFDYLLKVRVPDMAAYRIFLGDVLSRLPGIRETHSYPVMEVVKESSLLGLNPLKAQARRGT